MTQNQNQIDENSAIEALEKTPEKTNTDKAEKNKPKKKLPFGLKIVLYILLGLLVLVAIDTIVHWDWYRTYYNDIKRSSQISTERSEREKIIREDTYGGDTPEETYTIFREAMLKNDLEQAILYVDPFQRDIVKSFWEKMKNENKWNDYLQNDLLPIEEMEKENKDDYIRFKYLKDEAAKYLNDDGITTHDGTITIAHYIELSQNYITKKWKILSPVVQP